MFDGSITGLIQLLSLCTWILSYTKNTRVFFDENHNSIIPKKKIYCIVSCILKGFKAEKHPNKVVFIKRIFDDYDHYQRDEERNEIFSLSVFIFSYPPLRDTVAYFLLFHFTYCYLDSVVN